MVHASCTLMLLLLPFLPFPSISGATADHFMLHLQPAASLFREISPLLIALPVLCLCDAMPFLLSCCCLLLQVLQMLAFSGDW